MSEITQISHKVSPVSKARLVAVKDYYRENINSQESQTSLIDLLVRKEFNRLKLTLPKVEG